MLPSQTLIRVYLAFASLCALLEITNSRTSTMWKLNTKTEKIEKNDLMEEKTNNYATVDENLLYNFNAMADIYSKDKTFFTLVSSTGFDSYNSWLRQSAENSLESLLQARKSKTKTAPSTNNRKSHSPVTNINSENKIGMRNSSQNINILDCGQPINYTNYDYIINLHTQRKQKQLPMMPEPDIIYFFLQSHDKDSYKNFDIEALEKRLKYFVEKNLTSSELFHLIGNYWRIVGDPIQAIKCFRRSLDISPSAADVMYDLAKVLYNLQYLDDAINMARRSIDFQGHPFSTWRQYILLGDIMKTYGNLRSSIYYYRLALEVSPKQKLILKSLKEVDRKPMATLHIYTIVIIVILVVMVLVVILTSMINEVRDRYSNRQCSNILEINDVKPQRHFNRAMAIRSLRGVSTTSRSSRQRKY